MSNKTIIFLMIIATSLLLAKIYVANKLYFVSRNIQKKSIQINALKEERNLLKLKIEKLKYKNTIIDPLFNYKPKEPIVVENIDQDNIETNQNSTQEPTNIEDKPTNKHLEKKNAKELFETLDITKEEL